MLNPVAGTNEEIEVQDDAKGLGGFFGRHAMEEVKMNEDGSFARSDGNDPYNGANVGDFTRDLDQKSPLVKTIIGVITRTTMVTISKVVHDVADTYNKVKNRIKDFFGWGKKEESSKGNSGGGHSGGGKHDGGGGGGNGSGGSGGDGKNAGSGKKDRLLVPVEEMQVTVGRSNAAREKMDAATRSLEAAWNNLNRVWDGEIKAALLAEWAVLQGNVKKSDNAMKKSIEGLSRTIGLFTEAEETLISAANSLDDGVVPPLF